MARVKKVGHVMLCVHDIKAAAKFYKDVLGMEIVNALPFQNTFVTFLSFGERDVDIALMEVPREQIIESPGLSHVAFEIEGGEKELHQLFLKLKSHGINVEIAADHVSVKSLYFLDPDGNRLELYAQVMEQTAAKILLQNTQNINELFKPLHF